MILRCPFPVGRSYSRSRAAPAAHTASERRSQNACREWSAKGKDLPASRKETPMTLARGSAKRASATALKTLILPSPSREMMPVETLSSRLLMCRRMSCPEVSHREGEVAEERCRACAGGKPGGSAIPAYDEDFFSLS